MANEYEYEKQVGEEPAVKLERRLKKGQTIIRR